MVYEIVISQIDSGTKRVEVLECIAAVLLGTILVVVVVSRITL